MKANETYKDFWLATLKYENPSRFGFDWFLSALDLVWKSPDTLSPRWNDFEAFTRDCLCSTKLTDAEKVTILSEAIGAFTGRGAVNGTHTG